MSQALRMKPQVCFHQDINNLHSFRHFSKKNLKSLSTFTMTKPSTDNPNLKFHKLKSSSSSFKSVKHLDISSFNTKNFKDYQLKSIIKEFYKIKKFSGPRDNTIKKSLFLPFLILKNAKYLTNLNIEVSFNHLSRKFLSIIHLCKIKTLKLTQMEASEFDVEIKVNLSKSLPKTLEKFSLSWTDDEYVLFNMMIEFQQYPFSVNHLKNLQKLELRLPLALDNLRDILKSISDPSKLKILKFDLAKKEKEDDDVGKLLRGCVNIEELEIRTEKSSMIDFSLETRSMKLKKLVIYHSVEKNEDFFKLENLINHQKVSLESLSLRLKYLYHPLLSFDSLFESIKSLRSLKKFELKLIPYFHIEKALPISISLAEVVEELNCLEKLDLEEVPVDWKDSNFERLCQALVKKHSKSLKSLKLSCQNQADTLMQALKRLSRLEYLSLQNLETENSTFYKDLRDLVCKRNLGLNSVNIVENRRGGRKDEERENFIKMFHDIICKKTMKDFCYSEAFSGKFGGFDFIFFAGKLDLQEILSEIYHFRNLKIPSYICNSTFDRPNFEI